MKTASSTTSNAPRPNLLERTFVHIQGIGPKTEQGLWARGIESWSHFLRYEKVLFSPGRDHFIRQELETTVLHRHDIRFFSSRLSSREMWRLFDAFKEKAVYLDIETSGDTHGMDEITVIGLYDGHRIETFVSGINLNDFEMSIAGYELVITFSGTSFDLPMIRRFFPGISLPPAHIDLRFLLKQLGYAGGLKKIEKDLGICRDSAIDGMSGYDAVRLWNAYQWGDRAALETLIHYNSADVVNLKPLMEMAYLEMSQILNGVPTNDQQP
jgi:uncharacterized protein